MKTTLIALFCFIIALGGIFFSSSSESDPVNSPDFQKQYVNNVRKMIRSVEKEREKYLGENGIGALKINSALKFLNQNRNSDIKSRDFGEKAYSMYKKVSSISDLYIEKKITLDQYNNFFKSCAEIEGIPVPITSYCLRKLKKIGTDLSKIKANPDALDIVLNG